jgi:Ulp1 family protease
MEQIQHDTSLWRFRQRTWLSDDSIAYSVALWNKLFIDKRILVFSSHFFAPGTSTSFLGTYSAHAKARLWNGLRTNSFNWPQDVPTEWILIPYNIGGTHWVLFAYNCALGFWYSFDSFNANHLSVIRTINTALNTSYPAVVRNQVLDEGHYVQAAVPLQSDGHSCGVWVIAYIACFALGKKLPRSAYNAPEAFADRYRKYMLGCHLTNTVPHM